jgi:hypothetical protein
MGENRIMIHRFIATAAALLLTAGLLVAQPLVVRGTANLTPRTHVDLVGNYAYAVGANSFAVIDVSDPADPEITGQEAPGVATLLSVDVAGDYAYCAGQNSGVVILDVSDPGAPDWIANRILTGPVLHVSAYDTLVAVATSTSVFLLGASDPANTNILDSYGRDATWVHLDGARMEIFCGSNNGAYVLEIDDDELSLRDQFGNNAMSPVALAGSYANYGRGAEVPALHIESFNLAGTHDAFGVVEALAGGPGYSFVGLNTGEIQYVNQTQDDPVLVGSATVASGVTGLAVNPATRVLAASMSAGVTILEFEPLTTGERPALPAKLELSAYPNPFNSAAELKLTAPVHGQYTLTVTDVLGREVSRELFEFTGVKYYSLELNGRSAGSYFVRWSGPESAVVARLVYLP